MGKHLILICYLHLILIYATCAPRPPLRGVGNGGDIQGGKEDEVEKMAGLKKEEMQVKKE